jgi:hypothetical protein
MRSRIRIPIPHKVLKMSDPDSHPSETSAPDPHQIKKADHFDADPHLLSNNIGGFSCQTESSTMINNIYTQTQKATSAFYYRHVQYFQNVLKVFRKNYRLSL